MKKAEEFSFKTEDGAIKIEFKSGLNIKGIKLKFNSGKSGKFTAKYAENNVLSDLIYFGETEVENSSEIEIKAKKTVFTSDIFIFAADELLSGITKENIIVYEEKKAKEGECYPLYRDLELDGNYYIDEIKVLMPNDGLYYHYSIFTSLNGRDFDFLTEKKDNKISSPEGDVYNAEGREARIIRVYVEYASEGAVAEVEEISFCGRKSDTPFENKEVEVSDFEKSEYNVEIANEETIEEVYGIIKRRLGEEYCDWFAFSVEENPKEGHTYDYYEIDAAEGKILIKGNNGISLATGLNYYLKYFCNVNISQVGDMAKMPREIVFPKAPVSCETKAKIRYAYNYCTFSYSMAFWGENEWRRELDWLALNGVNAILDITGQEEVWRRFLGALGYSHKAVKDYITGPAYYAWAYMANMSSFGGPVHDSWFEERTSLARKNHLIMRKLGMVPILQGYSGMVPPDIKNYDKNADIIPQGKWGMFNRPYMLRTTSETFKRYAEIFYRVQREVYGDYSFYYATDPFHEGGDVADMSPFEIAKEVLSAMIKADDRAVWVIQSWQSNPTSELLRGIGEVDPKKEHALVLDLYAEVRPNYLNGGEGKKDHGYRGEFDKTPWVFCMLNNFGGRLGMCGHLDNIIKWVPKAFNEGEVIAGIGITPEASENNPILYDFFFECIWQENAAAPLEEIEIGEWLDKYCLRRYGAKSKSARAAWDIFLETVYKAKNNYIGQGAPECILNARPSLEVKSASTWGNAIICYDKSEFEKGAALLFEDYDKLIESDGYKYDIISAAQQVLSNRVQDYYNTMVECFKNKDISGFEKYSALILKTADDMEKILGCSEKYMLGRWLEMSKALAKNADDFSKKLYEFNARCLITTWGAYNQGVLGTIFDYSNRQWSGLIADFYKPRWERFIKNRRAELVGEDFEKEINYFENEWLWIRDNKSYPTKVNKLEKTYIENIFKN